MPAPQRPDPTPTEQLRAAVRAARRSVDPATRRRADAGIAARLVGLPELDGAPSVGWYLATDGEVDLTRAVQPLLERGVRLHLPVLGDGPTMRFAPWRPGAPVAANRFGIDEPVGVEPVGADQLQVVVVPSVVVDPDGHRLGFGAGYYDRALAGSSATKIGVVFDLQVVDHIEPEPWDVPLDVVITESRELRAAHRE